MPARIVLTIIGGAAMIVSAFLSWLRFELPPGAPDVVRTAGINLDWSIFYSTADPFGAKFYTSAGLVAIILGVLALLGLAVATGWLTRLAGALGIVAVVLYAVTLYRVPNEDFTIADIGLGGWVLALGSLVVLIGGFLGSRRAVVVSPAP
jgi:hypothetical protein